LIGLICYDDTEDEEQNRKHQTYAIMLGISAVFLAATLLIYIFLKELQNLQGKILISQVSTLLVSYIILSAMQFDVNMRLIHQEHYVYIGEIVRNHL